MGTCSILAALDLHDGHVTARVERRHRSREFIELLKDLDARYRADCTIRVVLDNHSSHISKETRAFQTTRPNRFEYVLTPSQRILQGIAEINAAPVVHRWRKFAVLNPVNQEML